MLVDNFIEILYQYNIDFFTGVPDSMLKSLCDFLENTYHDPGKHLIAVNEGNAVALAAGYHLSTGKIPCVYMQNSGIGNATNPIVSLLSKNVYSIPCLFVIGWRGEPGLKDEPQHVFQGKITLSLLDSLQIKHIVIDETTGEKEFQEKFIDLGKKLSLGESVAIVVKKNALTGSKTYKYTNSFNIKREEIINYIIEAAKDDVIVSTTGKTSRELFEIREMNGQTHENDFLTVGSMGHSSGIALGIAINKPNQRVWCIDGDGAALMHMGSMSLIGTKAPENFVHVLINNEAHESVGGQSTVAKYIDLKSIALACNYKQAYSTDNVLELKEILSSALEKAGPIFIEVKSAIGARSDLGRPTNTPKENKRIFMHKLEKKN